MGIIIHFGAAAGDEPEAPPDPLFVRMMVVMNSSDLMTGMDESSLPPEVREVLGLGDFAAAIYQVHPTQGTGQALRQALARYRQLHGRVDQGARPLLVALSQFEEKRFDPLRALLYYEWARLVASGADVQSASGSGLAASIELALKDGRDGRKTALEAADHLVKTTAATGNFNVQDQVAALSNLGLAHYCNDDLPAALQSSQEALELGQQPLKGSLRVVAGEDAGDRFMFEIHARPMIRSNMGLLYWRQGNAAKALELFQAAISGRNAVDMTFLGSDRQMLAQMEADTEEFGALLTMEKASGQVPTANVSLAFNLLVRHKGMVMDRQSRRLRYVRDMAAEASPEAPSRQRPTAALTYMEGQLQAGGAQARDFLAQLAASTGEDASKMDAIQSEMDRQAMVHQARRRTTDQLAAHLRNSPQPAAVGRMTDPASLMSMSMLAESIASLHPYHQRAPDLQTIQAQLPAGSALLEMVRYRPIDPDLRLPLERRMGAARYGTFIVRPTGAPVYVDWGDAEPLDKLIARFRRALARPAGDRAQLLGRELHTQLMRPVQAALADVSLVLLAPEGQLNLLPFGALVDDQDHYLIERLSFNYLSSARDLLRQNDSRAAPRSGAVIVANAAFGEVGDAAAPQGVATRSVDYSAMRFDPLPGTDAEAQGLRTLLSGAKLLTGEAATESAIKQVKGPRVLHIATHGFFLNDLQAGSTVVENPMLRSGLVFSGVNRLHSAADDGVLTAMEAAALDLVGTQLVVLSACETGLGEVRNGEGVFGLRRGFAIAGAQTLVMSLWKVDDQSTKDLMLAYYQRLARGEGRAEALRQAQLELMKRAEYSHPFFWASFIATGEAGAMK
ncbi:CHAT domain-containing protein [Variovorax sp. J22R133]|uniref:CHAT domain-containing protein n=1 Tax=Variovorax brevis TaxID=3053503 RepID=UPI002574A446|nr:CHAT domain-containing protein [Variovorax sp. J22R133]MDM0112282.1 CHAT domain-containing protein [Variovorax sp. J22R133]